MDCATATQIVIENTSLTVQASTQPRGYLQRSVEALG